MRRHLILFSTILILIILCFCSCERVENQGLGTSVSLVKMENNEIIVTYTDGTRESLGNISSYLEDEREDLEFYPLDDGTYAVGAGNAKFLSNIEIPERYRGKIVSQIIDGGFSTCASLKSIKLPSTIVKIGEGAFRGCTALEKINIPSGISSIGNNAFYSCGNLSYNLYDTGMYLGNEENPYVVFAKASSTTINSCEINENTKIVYHRAFYGCEYLREISIPFGVESVGFQAFGGCIRLGSLSIPHLNDGENGKDDMYLGYYFGAMANDKNGMYVPEALKSLTVLKGDTISPYALNGCYKIESVTLPQGIKSIGNEAFYGCSSLTSINLPSSLVSIGKHAFFNCVKLNEINLPSGITRIEEYTFYNCVGLTSVNIPQGVEYIGNSAFRSCTNLTEISIPNSTSTIGYSAFYGCGKIKAVFIPISVVTIDNDAFRECTNLMIYCEAQTMPKGWNLDWNYSRCHVEWGCKGIQ